MFIFSVQGFTGAASIQGLILEEFKALEKVPKEILLVCKDRSEKCMNTITNCLCGPNKNVNNFAFEKIEIDTMLNVIDYVKSTIINRGYKHFHIQTCVEDLAIAQNVIRTPIGELFGTNTILSETEVRSDEHDNSQDFLLLKMQECHKANFNVIPNVHRFDDNLKNFCVYDRIIGGRLHYQTFKANAFHSVPGLRAVDRRIAREKSTALEGEIRSKELFQYLKDLNLPLLVTLSEDATRIIGRPQYNQSNNQIVGFVLPYDENGIPKQGYFQGRSAAEIESVFYDLHTRKQKNIANNVIVVMAQPVARGIPPFCLQAFGTDLTYTALQVKQRWDFIVKKLNSLGIQVLAFGTDSDTRYNSTMRNQLSLGFKRQLEDPPEGFPEWFNIRFLRSFIPIQDTIHIGTKLRNRLLNTPLKIHIHEISYHHLLVLVDRYPKGVHKLTKAIVVPNDRQCFDNVLLLRRCNRFTRKKCTRDRRNCVFP